MSEAKFTKGPWVFDKYRNLNACGKQLKVEGVCIPCGHSKDEVRANMDLISLAPEMYEMLDLILNSNCRSSEFYEEIDALLTKARGES